MITLLIIIHVLVCLFLVAIVLLQHGKGADMGATFGSGSSQTLFGSEGPLPLLNKITTFSAMIFMGTSVSLAYLSAHESSGTVMSKLPVKEAAAPVKKEMPVTIPMPQEKPAAVNTEQKPVETAPVQSAPVAAEKTAEQKKAEVPAPQQAAPQTEKAAEPTVPTAQKTETVTPEQSAVPAEKKAE